MIKGIRKWLRNRKLYTAYPELRALDARIAQARRQHKPVRPLFRAKQQAIIRALRSTT